MACRQTQLGKRGLSGVGSYARILLLAVMLTFSLASIAWADDGSSGASPTTAHTLTFNANGGTGSMDPVSFAPPASGQNQVDIPFATFTNGSKVFIGWSYEQNGDVCIIDGGTYLLNDSKTLYAQ